MSNSQTTEHVAHRHGTRTEYVVGGVADCHHPAEDLEFLGHQGLNAYYTCDRCDSVIISAAEDD